MAYSNGSNGGKGNGNGGNGGRSRLTPTRAKQRRRARRQRGRAGRRALLIVGLLLVLGIAGGVSAAAFTGVEALRTNCTIESLQEVRIGAELVRVRGERAVPRDDPGGEQPAAARVRRDLALARQSHGRDRGSPVLEAQRSRLRVDRACRLRELQGAGRRPGRLDDHAAARPEPLPAGRNGADARAKGQGGVPRAEARRGLVEGAGSSRRT